MGVYGLNPSPAAITEHHRRHLDFAKFMILLSVAFLTVVASLLEKKVCLSWVMMGVLELHLGCIFFGVRLLYLMLWETVTPAQPTADQKQALVDQGILPYGELMQHIEVCHAIQARCFFWAFVLFVIDLLFFR